MSQAQGNPIEARFAALTRQLADKALCGQPSVSEKSELALLRQTEQQSAAKATKFAAIGRQIGDAHAAGRDTGQLVADAARLRAIERGA
jgi:hypothetical protein